MPSKASKRQAQQVLKAVESVFAPWVETGPGPKVITDYTDSGAPAVVWEEGPEAWPMTFLDSEVAPVVRVEQGVFIEPVNHVVLGVYPA